MAIDVNITDNYDSNKQFLYPNIYNKIHNAQLMGFTRNVKWLRKLFNSKHAEPNFFGTSSHMRAKRIDCLIEIIELYLKCYKENVDIGFHFSELSGNVTPYIKVLYKEIEIQNSQGTRHTIKDLIVIQTFKANGSTHFQPDRIKGLRLTRNENELFSAYNHSHLKGVDSSSWLAEPLYANSYSTFCIGNETDISFLEAELAVDYDIDRWELYLFLIDGVVSWESLEGTPYKSINKIGLPGTSAVPNESISESAVENIVYDLMFYRVELEADFYCTDYEIKIMPNKKFTEFIKTYLLSTRDREIITLRELKKTIVYKVENSYYPFDEAAVTQNYKFNFETPYTIINGVKKYCKIIKSNKEALVASIDQCTIHPKTLQNVIRKLEYEYSKKVSSRGSITFQDSFSHAL